ncbi:MAG: hypothetical protein IJC55_04345 [Clostridia bacterium]|nr:hypothetical protein [Clostridia bacterium]
MPYVLLIAAVVGLMLCTTKGNQRKGLIGVILALLYFPIGVIMALSKKYK